MIILKILLACVVAPVLMFAICLSAVICINIFRAAVDWVKEGLK